MFIAIVPAYNEEKKIGSIVRGLFEHVDEVVVVDDASLDNTSLEARAAGAIVLNHKVNCGQGAALETGHEYARAAGADYVLHFDGDGQFCTDDIGPALRELKKERADILFGSRFLSVHSHIPWLKRYFLFPIARTINRFSGVISLLDPQNGFRILNKEALDKIRIIQDRMAHATEIMALTKKYKLKFIEFPVRVTYYEYGQGFGGGVKIVRDLLLGKFVK